MLNPIWIADLAPAATPSWIWDGFIAPGSITLFSSPAKTGKTTLLSHLLARRRAGGNLLDRVVTAGVTAVVTEESAGDWQARHERLDLGANVCLFCRPFANLPTSEEYAQLLGQLRHLKEERSLDLVIFDPLADFLPARENDPTGLLQALHPLRRLAETGISFLLAHHTRKAYSTPGLAARGSSVLTAFADIIVELRRLNADDPADRRRVLTGFSRYAQTPPALRLELNAEATEYLCLPDPDPDAFSDNWPVLRVMLEGTCFKLTRSHILDEWSSDFPKPHPGTLARWLDRAVERGLVKRDGAGRKSDPFYYWLPEREGRLLGKREW
jgi:AAA domain